VSRICAGDGSTSVVVAAGTVRRAGPRGGADQRALADEPDLSHDSRPHGRRHHCVGRAAGFVTPVAAPVAAVGDLGAEGNVARAAIAAAGD
jgi:hypothetical protein